VLEFGERHGHLQQLPDGRLILVHDRIYPYESVSMVAHVGNAEGTVWGHGRYRLTPGFGYASSLALEDGTVLTATTVTPLGTDGVATAPRCGARVIRWQVPPWRGPSASRAVEKGCSP